MQWLNWVVPFLLGTTLAGIIAVVKIWNKTEMHGQALDQQGKEIEAEKRRNDAQDLRLGQNDTMLARIEEGVSWIRNALEKRFSGD